MQIFSRLMVMAMKEKGISYGELSKMTRIPKSALQRYATGETTKIPIDRISSIASALGVDERELLGWVKPAAPSDGLSESKKELFNILKSADDQQVQEVLDYANYVLSKK